jgi:hypothetical protein
MGLGVGLAAGAGYFALLILTQPPADTIYPDPYAQGRNAPPIIAKSPKCGPQEWDLPLNNPNNPDKWDKDLEDCWDAAEAAIDLGLLDGNDWKKVLDNVKKCMESKGHDFKE